MTGIQRLNRGLLSTLMSPATATIVADRLEELEREMEELRKFKKRLEWLHTYTGNDRDADGCEWGVYRVKWNAQGQPVEVWQTNSDFSDLDAEMRRSSNIADEPQPPKN